MGSETQGLATLDAGLKVRRGVTGFCRGQYIENIAAPLEKLAKMVGNCAGSGSYSFFLPTSTDGYRLFFFCLANLISFFVSIWSNPWQQGPSIKD